MTTRKERAVEDWLRAAYAHAEACPPPDAFLEESRRRMSREESERIQRHAAECPACAAERELASHWDATEEEIDARRADVDAVVAQLGGSEDRPRRPGGARGGLGYRWGLAAAASLAVAFLGTWILYSPPPPLPERTADPVLRGRRIEALHPAGELDALPETLGWQAVPEAKSYHVRLLRVDDSVLWEYEVIENEVALPREILGAMHRAVTYSWEVEALGAAGDVLARSDRVRFRAAPGG